MSSRRRSRSRDRASKSSSSKLRMDSKPQSTRITDPSLPAGRRREIDNVMKKARAASPNVYWDKKILEVEAKDPNRWRHSGYKSMYLDGSSSPSPHRRSRSPRSARSRSASRSRSRSYSRSPHPYSGGGGAGRRLSPRSPMVAASSRRGGGAGGGGASATSPRSPPMSVRRGGAVSPRSPRSPPRVSARRSSPVSNNQRGRARAPAPRSPPPVRNSGSGHHGSKGGRRGSARSVSGSSVSSCSDDSCSVCSPHNHRTRSRSRSPPPQRARPTTAKSSNSRAPVSNSRSVANAVAASSRHSGSRNAMASIARPPSPTSSPARGGPRMPRPMTPPSNRGGPRMIPQPMRVAPASTSSNDRPTDPRRQPPPPRPRNRAGDLIEVGSSKRVPSNAGGVAGLAAVVNKEPPQQPVLLTRIKKERTGPAPPKRVASPAGDSSGSEDSSESSTSAIVATTRLTLSERFGKMAQWSVDRERRENIENMRITKTGGDLKVMIEANEYLYGRAPSPAPRRYSISPVPDGHFPEDLLAAGAASRMAGWDDVRVRYQYYKELGYLRDLSIDDYVKWEEWWYKYQDWLSNEREYEQWLTHQQQAQLDGEGGEERRRGGRGRRRRRSGKRIPVSQRLN